MEISIGKKYLLFDNVIEIEKIENKVVTFFAQRIGEQEKCRVIVALDYFDTIDSLVELR